MKKHIRVVGAVILDDDDKVLCTQRPEGKNLALKWEFPGGKIEEGETPEAALIRELDEEMGCQIEVLDKITTTEFEYDFGIVELTTYYAEVSGGHIHLYEHHDMKWVERKDIHELDWAPADWPAINLIASS
jgi:8-oxo-dGTP diphosphatase